MANAKKVWSIKESDFPVYSGVLATGGDLVFYGTMDGCFRAVDAHSGKVLWEIKTASGIVGDPITFLGPDGKQYVAIYAGVGGWMGAVGAAQRLHRRPLCCARRGWRYEENQANDAPGRALYVFSF